MTKPNLRQLRAVKIVPPKKQVGWNVRTHGLARSIEYNVWKNMIRRCHNPTSIDFGRYGGRGISVCDEWIESFDQFLKDMGKRPSIEYQIERIDNSKGYGPKNCKWIHRSEQWISRRKGIFMRNAKGYFERNGKFYARIQINKKKIYLGKFDSAKEASDAFKAAQAEIYGERVNEEYIDPGPSQSRRVD